MFAADAVPVVILCGGHGTRIRGVSSELPKPMLNIGQQPILWHIIKSYQAHGFTEFILCLGYKSWKIKEYFLNYHLKTANFQLTVPGDSPPRLLEQEPDSRFRITFVETGAESMTGHRIWKVKEILNGVRNFCLTYGDGVSDIDLKSAFELHQRVGSVATVSGVRSVGRFGELNCEGDRITVFNEKPAVTSGYINGGFMFIDNLRVWEYFNPNPQLIFEKDVLPRLAEGGHLGVYKHHGFWQCMDTYRDFVMLNELYESGRAEWQKNWK